jgi:hypothetical protein
MDRKALKIWETEIAVDVKTINSDGDVYFSATDLKKWFERLRHCSLETEVKNSLWAVERALS